MPVLFWNFIGIPIYTSKEIISWDTLDSGYEIYLLFQMKVENCYLLSYEVELMQTFPQTFLFPLIGQDLNISFIFYCNPQ